MTKKELRNALDFIFNLKERGFTLQQLKDVYYPVCLLKYDFTLSELKEFGYSLKEIKSNTCFTDDLKKSKYTIKRINKTINAKITSYHEAGHIIIVFLYPKYCEFKEATIIPSKDNSGNCEYKFQKTIRSTNGEYDWEIPVIISFAGVLAEKILLNKKPFLKNKIGEGASGDYDIIRSVLKEKSNDRRGDYKNLYQECQGLIESNQITLNKIAEQLFIKKTLFKSDIENILQKYPLNRDFC